MVGYDFYYNGASLRDNGYMIVKSEKPEDFGLSRTPIKGNITAYKNAPLHFGTVYNGVLVIHFLIIKNVQKNPSNIKISFDELRELQKWLTSPKMPQSLFVEAYENRGTFEYIGLFTDVVPFEVGHLYGVELTFTCISQYPYQTEIKKIVCNDLEKGIVKNVFCDTDELNEAVHPIVTIVPTEDQIFCITNDKSGETMKFHLSLEYSKYVIDCEQKCIWGDGKTLNLYEVGWNISDLLKENVDSDNSYLHWLELYYGANKLTLKGKGTVTLEYKLPLKVGGYING